MISIIYGSIAYDLECPSCSLQSLPFADEESNRLFIWLENAKQPPYLQKDFQVKTEVIKRNFNTIGVKIDAVFFRYELNRR